MEANTDVIHNQRQKTPKVASDCYITRHSAYTVYITLLIKQTFVNDICAHIPKIFFHLNESLHLFKTQYAFLPLFNPNIDLLQAVKVTKSGQYDANQSVTSNKE